MPKADARIFAEVPAPKDSDVKDGRVLVMRYAAALKTANRRIRAGREFYTRVQDAFGQ